MSNVQIRTASYILKEQFGENVEKIILYLLRKGRKSLREITLETKLEKSLVKKCMCVALQHQLATFEMHKKRPITYRAAIDNILLRARYPKFVYNAKLLFGDIAELIVENILMNGADIISRIVVNVAGRLNSQDDQQGKNTDTSLVYQKVVALVSGHYLKRLPVTNEVQDGDDGDKDDAKQQEEEEAFLIPSGIIKAIGTKRKGKSSLGEPPSKRSKSDSSEQNELGEEYPDEGVFWHVNFERFQQHMFDQVIQAAVSERIDQSAAKIVNAILKETERDRCLTTESTRSLPSFEIKKKLPAIPVISEQELLQYLSLLSDQNHVGFVFKTDDSGGGMYCVNLKKSVDVLCQKTIESVVQERLGSKACRIFRLLLMKKTLEQKQIEELAMIPFKETKELLYKMIQERLVNLQEISKSGDYAPSRTFYLFSVDLPQTARLLLNRSYQLLKKGALAVNVDWFQLNDSIDQAMANLMSKRESLTTENKRLLEKNERIQGFLSALGQNEENQEDAIQELEELITPVEKEQLNRLKIDLARLEHGELQVDETIQILSHYLMFH